MYRATFFAVLFVFAEGLSQNPLSNNRLSAKSLNLNTLKEFSPSLKDPGQRTFQSRLEAVGLLAAQQQSVAEDLLPSGLPVDASLPVGSAAVYLTSSATSNTSSSAQLTWLNMTNKVGEALKGYQMSMSKAYEPSPPPDKLFWEVLGYVKSHEIWVEDLECDSFYVARVAAVTDNAVGQYGKESIVFSTPPCDAFWKDASATPDKVDVVTNIGEPLPLDASMKKKVFKCPNPGKRVAEDNATYTVNCSVPQYEKIKGPVYTKLPNVQN